jgi:hypothetical protein
VCTRCGEDRRGFGRATQSPVVPTVLAQAYIDAGKWLSPPIAEQYSLLPRGPASRRRDVNGIKEPRLHDVSKSVTVMSKKASPAIIGPAATTATRPCCWAQRSTSLRRATSLIEVDGRPIREPTRRRTDTAGHYRQRDPTVTSNRRRCAFSFDGPRAARFHRRGDCENSDVPARRQPS